MGGEWIKRTLRDAGVTLIDCDHRTPPAEDVGYPYVAIPQMQDGRLALDDARQISREHFLEWTRKARPTVGDVVLSRRCNPGETAYVPEGASFALGQNLVLLRSDGTSIYPPFLRWLLQGPEWWDQVQRHLNVGAVFDSLKCADIPRFELTIPPIDAQRTISDVLGSIDQRIELNGRMSRTLEAMARALFRSWFVDFDPVRAKAEGRETGLSDAIEKMFPREFQSSGVDVIPAGWTRAPLGSLVETLSGGTPSKGDPRLWNGDVPWISPKAMNETHADSADAFVTDAAIGNGTRLAPAGSVLVMVRGMGLHKHVRVSQARRAVAFNQDVKALVPRQVHPTLLLFALLDAQGFLLSQVESSGHGTGVLPTDRLLAYSLTLPSHENQSRLSAVFDSLNDRLASCRAEARTLASLRDALLPQLLSGAFRTEVGH